MINQKTKAKIVGKKAANLSQLTRYNISVPPFFIVNDKEIFPTNQFNGQGLFDIKTEKLEAVAEKITKQISTKLSGYPVILRMSVVGEDGPEHSFAGLFESVVVDAKKGVSDALKRCIKSLKKDRVETYCQTHDLKKPDTFSIIVQQYIPTDIAGVAFIEPNKDTLTISWSENGAETVVSGASSQTKQIDTTQPTKLQTNTIKDIGISGPSAKKLLKELINVADMYENGQDVEWGVADSHIHIFQTRDITRTIPKTDSSGVVLDATNISESYPGVTLPLTFSFIKDAYARVYPCFLKAVGVPDNKIDANDHIFANMLATLKGHVYYKIDNWYATLALLPGGSYLQDYFEDMLQPKKQKELKEAKSSWFSGFPVLIRFIWMMLRRKTQLQRFKKSFQNLYNTYESKKPQIATMSADKLLQTYQALHEKIFSFWHLAIANDFRVMVLHGLLKKWWLDISDKPHELHTLLTERAHLKSAIPLEKLKSLRIDIASSKQASQIWKQEISPENKLKKLREIDTINQKINHYIEAYGDRAPAELKLESPTLRENPAAITSLLSHVSVGDTKESTSEHTSLDWKQHLTNRYGTVCGSIFAPVFSFLITCTQNAIATREDMRIARSRAFGIARTFYSQIGKRFEEAGIISARDDVLYLQISEIENHIKSTAKKQNFKDRISCRKAEYDTYQKEDRPPMRVVRFPDGTYKDDTKAANSDLCGTGGAAGKVAGEALVLPEFDPAAEYEDKILITQQTDPGWTLVFGSLKGVVTEHGNPLSHAAIVARELGIPACLGVDNVTEKITTGDQIRIDGTTGNVIKV